ncbi:unnamed protein product [Phytophthora lilii]|uniref:Unnamed protein product n=1 Tax=Phytophthora lilii TaxID=2077276 RepID=A0A9W6TLC2_9STRA|nr:unnamed protein product [Phytophthora lilii]
MSTTTSAKPKAKFSSRNLSAVFKAPLRSKPLPDHAAGPLPRTNGRMLVLGRAAVAPPAPLNTPSLKRESQVHDVRVSLVPAGSNWAEAAEKASKTEQPEHAPAPADAVAPAAPPEKAWAPESVAEHLHTTIVPAPPKVAVQSSGRWGDDAVEHDIMQINIRRQMQKERDFPDLKEAVEEAQMQHHYGHAPAGGRSPAMGPQQSEQHRGRATGRWAHFSEQEEARRPMQEGHWPRERYGRDDDDRWSRGRYSRDDEGDRYEDDRWSRGRYSRYDDGYGREQRSDESALLAASVSPVPNDSSTHFSRSDARFDMVASGNSDRVLSHSPHRMNWGSSRWGRRDGRSPSPVTLNAPEDSCAHESRPNRSLIQSPASASPSPSPASPPLTAEAAPARAMNWRSHLVSPHHAPVDASRRTVIPWPKVDEPHTHVAEDAASNTESSSNSSASSSPSPPQQVQVLQRSKMLFDPKTGGMVNAGDAFGPGKRQQNGRNTGKDRDTAASSVGSKPALEQSRNNTKTSDVQTGRESKPSGKGDNAHENQTAENFVAVNAVELTVKEDPSSSETSLPSASSEKALEKADNTATGASTANDSVKRVVAKQPAEKVSGTRRDSRSTGSRPSNGKPVERSKRGTSARNDRRETGASNNAQKMKDSCVGKQERIEVSSKDTSFETDHRRVVLPEKKQRHQGVTPAEAIALVSEKTSTSAEVCAVAQSKGEEVQETFGLAAKKVGTQHSSKPRGSTRNAKQTNRDRKATPTKGATKQPKQSTRVSGSKNKETKQGAVNKASSVNTTLAARRVKPMEQVAGEAPAESLISKKRSQYVKVETKREQLKHEKQGNDAKANSPRKSIDRKVASNAVGGARKQEQSKRQGSERSARTASDRVVEKAPTAKARGAATAATKARPKQARRVYVVKTPAAPVPASATSTAA